MHAPALSYSLQFSALFEGGVDGRQLRTVQLDDPPSLQSHHDYSCGLSGSPISAKLRKQ